MPRGLYRIADTVIEIDSIFDDVHTLCREYGTSGEARFRIAVSREDIALERERAQREDRLEGRVGAAYSDAYLETLAVYRKFAELAISDGILLVHGSALAIDGRACLFTARSGTGKSTHARLWRKVFGDRIVMINDDKPMIRLRGGRVEIFGTPWNGKHRIGNPVCYPLCTVAFLSRSPRNTIQPLTLGDAYPQLLAATYRPSTPVGTAATLGLLDEVLRSVAPYALGCNMEDEAALISYEGMKELHL